jgi:cytochrome c
MLVKKIKDGGKGNWGNVPMPPHPQLKEKDIEKIVTWILSI